MALGTYSDISAAVGDWDERTYTTAETDEFIRLAEAKADRKLRQDFRRRSQGTLTTDSDGLVTLPSGFVGMTSLVRDVTGSLPLKQVSWDSLVGRNPYQVSDDPNVYAMYRTTLRVSPAAEDDFIAIYSAVLAGLSATNTTNWLLALAPDYYLFACQAAAAAKQRDYATAGALQAQADDILDDLVTQGNVAEYGNAEMTLFGGACVP